MSMPESADEEGMISHDDGEGELEDDEGAVDILEGDHLGDEDLIAAAGFSIL
jgi:hypothetical protein